MIAQHRVPRAHHVAKPAPRGGRVLAPVRAPSRTPAPRGPAPPGASPIVLPVPSDPLAGILARAVAGRTGAAAVPVPARRTLARATFKPGDFKRPGFSTDTYRMAVDAHNLFRGADIDRYDAGLQNRNMAVPHRFSWKSIRDNTLLFLNREEDDDDFERWTDRMLDDGYYDKRAQVSSLLRRSRRKHAKIKKDDEWDDRLDALEDKIAVCNGILLHMAGSRSDCRHARSALIKKVNKYWKAVDDDEDPSRAGVKSAAIEFFKLMNNFFPNVPDLGPHRGTNIQVRERMHVNVDESGNMSPFSSRMVEMSPHRSDGVAVDDEDRIVGTFGTLVKQKRLDKPVRRRIRSHGTHTVNYRREKFNWKR